MPLSTSGPNPDSPISISDVVLAPSLGKLIGEGGTLYCGGIAAEAKRSLRRDNGKILQKVIRRKLFKTRRARIVPLAARWRERHLLCVVAGLLCRPWEIVAGAARLGEVNAELPEVLIHIVCEVLQLVGRNRIALLGRIDVGVNLLLEDGDAVDHELDGIVIGDVAGRKVGKLGGLGDGAIAAVDAVAELEVALGKDVCLCAIKVGLGLVVLVQNQVEGTVEVPVNFLVVVERREKINDELLHKLGGLFAIRVGWQREAMLEAGRPAVASRYFARRVPAPRQLL